MMIDEVNCNILQYSFRYFPVIFNELFKSSMKLLIRVPLPRQKLEPGPQSTKKDIKTV
jgi:multisubunit Na+/H+ antiporter MnhE subunit